MLVKTNGSLKQYVCNCPNSRVGFTEFICACLDCVERFRILQPTDSVIVMVIRKHVVEW